MRKIVLYRRTVVLLAVIIFIPAAIFSQLQKIIHTHYQFWTSINTTAKIDTHWFMVGDVHVRRAHFTSDPDFYFVRAGAGYAFNKKLSVVTGYGHMWLASSVQQHYVYAGENRFYQQFQYNIKWKNTGITQRLRNEQRWQQKIVNGKTTGYDRFSDRIRYLLAVTIPVFKNDKLPVIVVADEAAVHFGKEIVYNRFDQNRIFIGIKQKLSPVLSFDFGYMNQYQEKYTAGQADNNHIFRLFFYYSPSL